jgi:hypothetical protein
MLRSLYSYYWCAWQSLLGVAIHGQGARSRDLFDADWFEQSQQRFDLALIAGDFNGVMITAHVHNLASEDIDDTQHFGPGLSAGLTRINAISRLTASSMLKSRTLMTLINLLICFSICSIKGGLAFVVTVIRDTAASMVGATHRLSMLNPRPLNNPATRESTPGSLSTNRVRICRLSSCIGHPNQNFRLDRIRLTAFR